MITQVGGGTGGKAVRRVATGCLLKTRRLDGQQGVEGSKGSRDTYNAATMPCQTSRLLSVQYHAATAGYRMSDSLRSGQ